ncbi:MAG: endonuclease/exonuclease/phosphatase family protein [Bacteroidales bacterium]|nr:endonuclease/exonuclease/phosphatase family protein [Bacteroidales bacterium]
MRLVRLLLVALNVVCAILLLASTLAGEVPPSRWVGISLLSYGYVLFFGLNVAFVLLWIVLRRWTFLLSVAAIVLRHSFIPLFFQLGFVSGGGNSSDSSTLKVMTFNVHNFVGRDGELPYGEGAAKFVNLVRQQQPDVLCVQEFYSNAVAYNVVDSLSRMGYRYRHGYKGASYGLLLFSKYKLRNVKDLGHSRKFYADIQKDGIPVRLLCVHLASYHLEYDDLATMDNLAHGQRDSNTFGMVSKFCRTIRQHEQEWRDDLLPVIESYDGALMLIGDCNDTPASYLYQQAVLHLTDTYRERGFGLGTTYHGPFPAYRIDYLFHNAALTALNYKRIRCDISDHYPLVAEYALQ